MTTSEFPNPPETQQLLIEFLETEATMAGAELPNLADLVQRPLWMAQAACKGRTSRLFPELGQQTVEARQLCARCPVQEPCLDAALTAHEPYGIWAGTSRVERNRLARTAA